MDDPHVVLAACRGLFGHWTPYFETTFERNQRLQCHGVARDPRFSAVWCRLLFLFLPSSLSSYLDFRISHLQIYKNPLICWFFNSIVDSSISPPFNFSSFKFDPRSFYLYLLCLNFFLKLTFFYDFTLFWFFSPNKFHLHSYSYHFFFYFDNFLKLVHNKLLDWIRI